MKNALCIAMASAMIMNSVPAYAATSTYNKALCSTKTGNKVKAARVSLGAETTLKAHTNWVSYGQWVRSDGASFVSTKKVSGYKYKMAKNSHKIRAKVTGMKVDLQMSSEEIGVSVTGSGSDRTYSCNTPYWSYQIEGDCCSLLGYKEWHSVKYYLENKQGAKLETFQFLDSMSLY